MDDARLSAIESRLQLLETRDAVAAVHHQNITVRLDGIEDTLKWLVRLIIGGLVAAGVAFLVQGGLVIP